MQTYFIIVLPQSQLIIQLNLSLFRSDKLNCLKLQTSDKISKHKINPNPKQNLNQPFYSDKIVN
jgi:hypothetical protein